MEALMEKSEKVRGINLAATPSAKLVDGAGAREVAAIVGTAAGKVVAAKVRVSRDGEWWRERLPRGRC